MRASGLRYVGQKRLAALSAVAIIAACIGTFASVAAGSEIELPDRMISEYMHEFDVGHQIAESRLTTQEMGTKLDTLLREDENDAYGGILFENETGVLTVLMTDRADISSVKRLAAGVGLDASEYDIRSARNSMVELEEHQDTIEAKLAEQVSSGVLTTAIDIASNKVEVMIEEDAPREAEEAARRAVSDDPLVRKESVPAQSLNVALRFCIPYFNECSRPLRGGVKFYSMFTAQYCTTGFIGYEEVRRVLFTAGHCRLNETHPRWVADEAGTQQSPKIGTTKRWAFGPTGDSMIIKTDGVSCGWCPDVTSPIIMASLVDETAPIKSRAWSYPGLYVCQFGIITDISCGLVTHVNYTAYYQAEDVVVNGLFRTTACTIPGDSGGPVIAGYAAIGINSGGSDEVGCSGTTYSVHDEILRAEQRLDATVLVRSP